MWIYSRGQILPRKQSSCEHPWVQVRCQVMLVCPCQESGLSTQWTPCQLPPGQQVTIRTMPSGMFCLWLPLTEMYVPGLGPVSNGFPQLFYFSSWFTESVCKHTHRNKLGSSMVLFGFAVLGTEPRPLAYATRCSHTEVHHQHREHPH